MFDLNSIAQTHFTWNTALSLALASDLVYQRGEAVQSVCTRNWLLDRCEFLEQSDTECFVAGTDAAVIVAFRGTESLSDWLSDLNVFSTQRPYGKVHRGFVKAFSVIESQLVEVLDSFDPQGKVIHLTGHSLGAALATIAACELRERFPITAMYTFGQPRLGDGTTVEFIDTHYTSGFHRFVFDDDIVTRVPPGYKHVGRLFHFDSNGFLQNQPGEAVGAGTTELPELTEDEFNGLKAATEEITQAAKKSVAPGDTEALAELADRSVEGLLPSVRDHRMSNYLFGVRNQIPRAAESLNESVVYSAIEMFQSATFTDQRDEGELYPAQVRVRDLEWTPPAGVVVNSQIGPYFSLQATKKEIGNMQHDNRVMSVELGRELDFPSSKQCSVSVPFVNADSIHTGTLKEKGDQAIVALIDTGIDILHESFLDSAGAVSRIDAVWVQRDKSGQTPKQVDPNVFKQDYGTLYLGNAIQTFVNADLFNNNNTTPGLLRDSDGHGTHVASIAAGRAVGTFGGGMAPDARIVMVVPHMKTTPPNPPSLGYSNSHQDALDFLMAYKKSQSLPMAVNVSLGMNAGAHDGRSSLEKVFDSVTVKGKEEGFVIVKSAGNERGHKGHTRVQASTAGTMMIEWESLDIDRTQDYFEFWYSEFDELEFKLVDPSGSVSPPISHTSRTRQFSSQGNDVHLDLTVHHTDNDDNVLTIRVIPVGQKIQRGKWKLEVLARALGPENGMVDGWVERNDARPIEFVIDQPNMTLSIPGTADTVVSVAATDTSTPANLAASSSFGPTRKNGPKPDVSAPGERITAARSNLVDHQAVVTISGTSMAAPHVTGAMALVVSARHKKVQGDATKRQFNAINLAGMLKRSAKGYNRLHNIGYGYGGLDAARLFTEADLQ